MDRCVVLQRVGGGSTGEVLFEQYSRRTIVPVSPDSEGTVQFSVAQFSWGRDCSTSVSVSSSVAELAEQLSYTEVDQQTTQRMEKNGLEHQSQTNKSIWSSERYCAPAAPRGRIMTWH